ncbi:hypothetical protein ACGFZP_05030 [Kitasatospora sp. NPDC048239]|uniref:hypothetical protein n=1 Tax=Kitasatospora sp. NPDC048239 TaxID=3364046 RepID=UPI003720D656
MTDPDDRYYLDTRSPEWRAAVAGVDVYLAKQRARHQLAAEQPASAASAASADDSPDAE